MALLKILAVKISSLLRRQAAINFLAKGISLVAVYKSSCSLSEEQSFLGDNPKK